MLLVDLVGLKDDASVEERIARIGERRDDVTIAKDALEEAGASRRASRPSSRGTSSTRTPIIFLMKG